MKILFFSVCLILIAVVGCNKNNDLSSQINAPSDQGLYFKPSAQYLASLDALTKPVALTSRSACQWTEIPAGSVNALAAAVSNTCAGGVIYLKTGVHTETGIVTISKSVIIIGQAGAVLKLKSALSPTDPATGSIVLKPGLHFLNAPNSAILDVDIQPADADANTALLFENSGLSAVIRCKITNFQFSIVVEKSERMVVLNNTVKTTSAWTTGAVDEAHGIVVINGPSAYVAGNDVSNALFSIWACDKWGTCENNNTHDNFIGVILCNVPKYLTLPNGQVTGSLFPATGWKTRNNKSTDNADAGYLVVDGSNRNIIENNDAARNGTYDMELTTDTYRFGFLTPMSHDNIVSAGAYPYIRIKDCGTNNQITGGVRVNTGTDPCK